MRGLIIFTKCQELPMNLYYMLKIHKMHQENTTYSAVAPARGACHILVMGSATLSSQRWLGEWAVVEQVGFQAREGSGTGQVSC